jgi:hypothetical protein
MIDLWHVINAVLLGGGWWDFCRLERHLHRYPLDQLYVWQAAAEELNENCSCVQSSTHVHDMIPFRLRHS